MDNSCVILFLAKIDGYSSWCIKAEPFLHLTMTTYYNKEAIEKTKGVSCIDDGVK
jgi:hypothetical protein